jgi:hypothetical protein
MPVRQIPGHSAPRDPFRLSWLGEQLLPSLNPSLA